MKPDFAFVIGQEIVQVTKLEIIRGVVLSRQRMCCRVMTTYDKYWLDTRDGAKAIVVYEDSQDTFSAETYDMAKFTKLIGNNES